MVRRLTESVRSGCSLPTFLGIGLCLALSLLLAGSLPGTAEAQGGDHRAGLVVRFGDGKVETRCVHFSEPDITGEQLMERSGLQVIINYNGSFGGTVCSVNGEGCRYPSEDCFCRCLGAQCEYWAYYRWVDGAWEYSQVGATGIKVVDGDLQGWSWGPGNFQSGTEPPLVSFAEVCSATDTGVSAAAGDANSRPAIAWTQYAAYGAVLLLLAGMGLVVLLRRRA